MVNEVSYESQLEFLEHDFDVVIPVERVVESPILVVGDGSYELVQSGVCVVSLCYQDCHYLVQLSEAVEKAHPVGCSQMFQHCHTEVGSSSSIHPFWLC